MVKKKPAEQPHEEHADETWLIPYSDLLTLLLALFIVLFASSSLDKNKAAQIQYALASALVPMLRALHWILPALFSLSEAPIP